MSTPFLPTGSDDEAHFHQQVHKQVFGPGAKIRSSSTVRVSHTHNGTFLHVKPGTPATPAAARPVTIAEYAFVKMFQNYVIGKNTTTMAMVQIAKPPKHRNSITLEVIDGVAFTISYPQNPGGSAANAALQYFSRLKAGVSGGVGISENQRVTPEWLANDLFYAFQTATAIVSEAADTSTPTGTAIGWQDWNVDGRAWAATPDGNP